MNKSTYRVLKVTVWSMKKSDVQMWGATPEGESLGLACDFETRWIREFALPSPAACPAPARLL